MAPRTAKAKKTSNTKIAETEAPKKGRGKTTTVEDPEIGAIETEVDDVQVIDKKTKRGKKGDAETNGQQETNGFSEEKALPAKKGRKKKADSPNENKGIDTEENKPSHPDGDAEAQPESERQEEVPASGGRGKKPAKKEVAGKPKPELKSSNIGKKKTKDETENEDKEANEDLVKPAAKGKSRKATQKANKEPEPQGDTIDEKVKESPKKDGRKRGQTKPAKENTPENEQGDLDTEDNPVEHPKKKESKGRKNNAKKPAKTEDESEEAKPEPASKKRKVAKKDEKDYVKNGEVEEPAAEPKPAKGKRGLKKDAPAPAPTPAEPEEGAEAGDTANKRRRKADEKVSSADKKSKAPLKNKSSTNYEEIDFSNLSKTVEGKEWNLKISSWNVDGIRAWLTKGGLDYIKYEKPDILCLQETKCAKDKLPDEISNLPGYHAYWQGSNTEGYAGVGIYTTKLAISVQYGLGNEELDAEGRMITAEYEQFYLICTYVPNAGRKLVTLPKRLQWNEEFRKYVKALNEKKPVIICGDMNVAHNEIDLANPKSNKKNAGFTPEERAGMTDLIGDGFVDSFRHLHPDDTGAYTFWTYMMNARFKNVGWRLDYSLLSERLIPSLCDSVIRSEVFGSDHCPITLFLHMTSANKPKE